MILYSQKQKEPEQEKEGSGKKMEGRDKEIALGVKYFPKILWFILLNSMLNGRKGAWGYE